MADAVSDDARLAAEIERLKAEFPKTRDLYREVCALLFFRFGVTPTANRLYQLVHRGSMGTPTAVLSEFWSTLREKSRVRIEHPDLPAEVQQAAGELVAKLWSRATAAADASLDGMRADVEAQQRDAQQSIAAIQADLAHTETALEQRTAALLSAQVRIHELEQSLAVTEAARAALDEELARLRLQARDHEATLRQARTAGQALADARAQVQALHEQLGELRHRNGTLEGQLQALREMNAWRGETVSGTRAASAKRARPRGAEKSDASAAAAKAVGSAKARKVKGSGSGPRSGS